MTWLGETSSVWPIDSEIGDAGVLTPSFGPLFGFHRLDISLEQAWIKEHLGVTLDAKAVQKLRLMDDPANIAVCYELGARAAERQLSPKTLDTW